MTPASARATSMPAAAAAAADELDQLGGWEDGVGTLDEGHLQPEPLDRNADLGGRVGHLAGALGDRVVAEHEAAAAAPRERRERQQAGAIQEALQVGPHAVTGKRRPSRRRSAATRSARAMACDSVVRRQPSTRTVWRRWSVQWSLWGSAPRRKLNSAAPRPIISSITMPSRTSPGESSAAAGSKPHW